MSAGAAVFLAKSGAPVEVRAWLGNEGLGWFVLERMRPGGDYELIARSTKAPDADDEIAHQFPKAELEASLWASLKLRLKLNALSQNGDDMSIYLRASQAGAALPAIDRVGEPIKDSKGRVKVGDAKTNVPVLYDFAIWFE